MKPSKTNLNKAFDDVFGRIEKIYEEALKIKTPVAENIALGCKVVAEMTKEYQDTPGYANGAKIIQMNLVSNKLDMIEGRSLDEQYQILSDVAEIINDKNHKIERTSNGVRTDVKATKFDKAEL